MKNRGTPQAHAGFSLIELVVVVVILATALAIAAPNFRGWIENYRLQGAARGLYSNMQRAKSEAIKRNCSIGIVFSKPVSPLPANPTPLQKRGGYTVFIDDGSGAGGVAGNATQDGTEQTLAQVTMPKGCTLSKADFGPTGSIAPRTGYNSRGFPGNKTGSAQLDNNNSVFYTMSLSNSGYPKIRKNG